MRIKQKRTLRIMQGSSNSRTACSILFERDKRLHILAFGAHRFFCRMTDRNQRRDLLSLWDLHDLRNFFLVKDAHDNRTQVKCVCGKAEGLRSNAGIERLPVRTLRGGERTVPLVARTAGDHGQHHQRGGRPPWSSG